MLASDHLWIRWNSRTYCCVILVTLTRILFSWRWTLTVDLTDATVLLHISWSVLVDLINISCPYFLVQCAYFVPWNHFRHLMKVFRVLKIHKYFLKPWNSNSLVLAHFKILQKDLQKDIFLVEALIKFFMFTVYH